MTWLEKLRGKRTRDIELKAEGPRDPKLPTRSTADAVKEGIGQLKKMREQRKAYRDRVEEALNTK